MYMCTLHLGLQFLYIPSLDGLAMPPLLFPCVTLGDPHGLG